MAYFRQFPKVNYDVLGNRTTTRMTNLTRRTRLRDFVKLNNVSFDFYDIKSGETPEYIANEFYGDSELHWLILMANDIVDYYTEWPMNVQMFEQYIKEKYEDVNGVHHYEIFQTSGDTTKTIEIPNDSANTIPVDAVTITNYEYEDRLQNSRRRIRLIRPEFISQIKKEFRSKMNG
jgi:hypothetical protein